MDDTPIGIRWLAAAAAVFSVVVVARAATAAPPRVPSPGAVPTAAGFDPFTTAAGDIAAYGPRAVCELRAGVWEPGRPEQTTRSSFNRRILIGDRSDIDQLQ